MHRGSCTDSSPGSTTSENNVSNRRSDLRAYGMPRFHYVEFAGIHTDPSLRCGGNRIPNSTSALMTGRLKQKGFQAAGAAAFIPSFAQGGSGSSGRSFRVNQPGHAACAQAVLPLYGMPRFHCVVFAGIRAGCSLTLHGRGGGSRGACRRTRS